MMQTPPINTPAHGCVPVVGRVVVVVDGGAVVVVLDGGGAVVVVVAAMVVDVDGFVVVVVLASVVVDVGGFVVVVVPAVVLVAPVVVDVVDELTGGVPALVDGTHSPKPDSKNRRRLGMTRASKHTRSVGPAAVGCTPEGVQTSHGSSTRADRPSTVTGNGGANRTEFREG
jgi:hypothetical protein